MDGDKSTAIEIRLNSTDRGQDIQENKDSKGHNKNTKR